MLVAKSEILLISVINYTDLYGSLRLFHGTLKMVFGNEKCKTLIIAKGKLEMRNFKTEDADTMEAMNQDDIYRYFGHMQSKQINHTQIKQKLGEEYINLTKSILKTKLNEKNTIKAINTYATPVLTFSFGMVKWTPTDRETPNQNEDVTHKI